MAKSRIDEQAVQALFNKYQSAAPVVVALEKCEPELRKEALEMLQ